MALGTDLKIFTKGRSVHYAYNSGVYLPYEAVVQGVERGRVRISFKFDEEITVSPQSRLLCLTYQECECMCNLLNVHSRYMRELQSDSM